MWWIPLAMMAASAISGSMKNKNTSTSNSMPSIDPQYKPLQDLILPSITQRLKNPTGLPAGYAENNTRSINDTYAGAQMGLDNRLSARGLSRSPVAGAADTSLANHRAGDISRMKSQIPMLEDEMQRTNLMQALQVLGMGRGQTQIMTGPQGGGVSGGIDGAAQMLGFLYGSGAFGGKGIGQSVPATAPGVG